MLREDLGGTYGVSVVPDFTKRPAEEYRLTITFACDPARTQDLVKALFTVVDEFKTDGPSAGQVADAQAALRRDLETDSRQNGYCAEPVAVRLPVRRAAPDAAKLRALYDSADVVYAARRGAHVSRHEPLCESRPDAGESKC